MAVARPWITPDDVREYTDHEEVKSRSDTKLRVDITRAEQRVISITHNLFDRDSDAEIPDRVKIATIICADAYAKNSIEKAKKQIKSETFDDYSYSAESGCINMDELDIYDLIKDYVIAESRGNIFLRISAL